MGILIYRRQRVDYGEQEDTTCLVSQFTSYVAGPSEICPPRISMERSRTASPVECIIATWFIVSCICTLQYTLKVIRQLNSYEI